MTAQLRDTCLPGVQARNLDEIQSTSRLKDIRLYRAHLDLTSAIINAGTCRLRTGWTPTPNPKKTG
jgi:hypothetical protein